MRVFLLLLSVTVFIYGVSCNTGDLIEELIEVLEHERSVDLTERQADHGSLYSPSLRIGSFNIQVFGKTKMKKTDVVDALVKILPRYDILLVQEIRDSSETALPELVDDLKNAGTTFKYTVSERLGRTNSKEQYAYLYNPERVSLREVYQYPEAEDKFERPPYVARFTSPSTEITDFAMIGCHIKPSEAVQELNNMVDVYDKVQQMWGLKNTIIAGDFNADCGYLTDSEEDSLKLYTDDRFTWIVSDEMDSTVATSSCSYDRFILTGDMANNVVPGSVKAYHFDKVLGLTQDEADDVSDHYPIEFELLGKVDHEVEQYVHTSVSLNEEYTDCGSYVAKALTSATPSYFSKEVLYDQDGNEAVVSFVTSGTPKPIDTIRRDIQGMIPQELIQVAEAYWAQKLLKKTPSLPGIPSLKMETYDVKISYVVSKNSCSVAITKRMIG